MDLSDITDGAGSEWIVQRARDKLIDDYIASIGDEELNAIAETVAMEHERHWPPLGKLIRRANPRTSPAVRAKIFALLPPPEGEP